MSAQRGANGDAIRVLKDDHMAVKDLFRRYGQLGSRAQKAKQELVQKMIRELSIHASIEEQILYPTVARALPNGARLRDEALEEHQTAKQILAALDKLSPDDDGFEEGVKALIKDVRHHIREEEGEMFPRLRRALDREQLHGMGNMMRMAKKTAPTRPHPNAPSKPPANIVAGLISAPADRIRDAARAVMGGSSRA